jgi:hypothetical protein
VEWKEGKTHYVANSLSCAPYLVKSAATDPASEQSYKNWAKDREIIVNNSALNPPTSNSLAERAVGIVKHMLLNHHVNYEVIMNALMEFRATLLTDSYLPSQVSYGTISALTLRMRTDLSAAESARQRVSDSKCNSASSKARQGQT